MSALKFVFLAIICASLIISAVFSVQSLTGYLISDKVNDAYNVSAFFFFLIGLFGAWLYVYNFRDKKIKQQ